MGPPTRLQSPTPLTTRTATSQSHYTTCYHCTDKKAQYVLLQSEAAQSLNNKIVKDVLYLSMNHEQTRPAIEKIYLKASCWTKHIINRSEEHTSELQSR